MFTVYAQPGPLIAHHLKSCKKLQYESSLKFTINFGQCLKKENSDHNEFQLNLQSITGVSNLIHTHRTCIHTGPIWTRLYILGLSPFSLNSSSNICTQVGSSNSAFLLKSLPHSNSTGTKLGALKVLFDTESEVDLSDPSGTSNSNTVIASLYTNGKCILHQVLLMYFF